MEKYLRRHDVLWTDIKYIVRENKKTNIYLTDGRVLETYNTVKAFLEVLPAKEFALINKGIVVAKRRIRSINQLMYTMDDGMEFMGRVRESGGHVKNRAEFNTSLKSKGVTRQKDMDFMSSFAILDDYPLAFCVIEITFDEKQRGMDFIFRYCNKEMEILENRKIEEMVDKSFFDVFDNADKKWLSIYADVALNGKKVSLEGEYSPEIDAYLDVYCYQPKLNFCACTLIVNKRGKR